MLHDGRGTQEVPASAVVAEMVMESGGFLVRRTAYSMSWKFHLGLEICNWGSHQLSGDTVVIV